MDRLNIRTKNRKFETAKDLYGIFFEDINRAGDGGIYPEMIRNRCFEDSLLPGGIYAAGRWSSCCDRFRMGR